MTKYSDYCNTFSIENIIKLLKYIEINNHAIKLETSKQSFFSPIYSLESVELEILKIYIKISLTNNFIWPSKSSAKAFILSDYKLNKSFYLYINY